MIYVTNHAITRYQQRVKPMHDFPQAKQELEALVRATDEMRSGLPDWFHDNGQDTEGWLDLSDGIAALVLNGVATTVVCRSESHPARRAYKNQLKAKRRKRKKKPPFKPRRGREKAGKIWR